MNHLDAIKKGGEELSVTGYRIQRRITPLIVGLMVALFAVASIGTPSDVSDDEAGVVPDMLTPVYYLADSAAPFRIAVDQFIACARQIRFSHPFDDGTGMLPDLLTHTTGVFGSVKGPNQGSQHHPAVDLYVAGRISDVALYAAHDGLVQTYRDAAKYRHYLSITKEIVDEGGSLLGLIVTLYAHLDLDRDEASGLDLDGEVVQQGDLLSRHLYAGTVGGPHLHLEIRYYRPTDLGVETFYGSRFGPSGNTNLTLASEGIWSYGSWHPDVGYGFADPRNHGLNLP